MASSEAATYDKRVLESLVDTGNEKSLEITLSATPGTITNITLPDAAKGFRLFPRTNHIRFSVNNTSPAAVGTVAANDQTVVAADFAVGGIAKADLWETRLLPHGKNRTLSLRSITGSVVVDCEVF